MMRVYHAVLGYLTGTLYLHHKGGVYRKIGNGTDSTNGRGDSPVVVYFSLRRGKLLTRVRPEWEEPVFWVGQSTHAGRPEGVFRPRFARLDWRFKP